MNNATTSNALDKVLKFLARLEAAKLWYRLEHVRESLMVVVAVPGERWEVEFFEDGHVEYERFRSTGVNRDEEELDRLLKEQEEGDTWSDSDSVA